MACLSAAGMAKEMLCMVPVRCASRMVICRLSPMSRLPAILLACISSLACSNPPMMQLQPGC